MRALAGATLALPCAARAQAAPVIGFLHAGSPEENRATAKALALDISPTLLATADDVIE